jgi:glutamyl-Q tRNA(Asp) synthetase
MTQDVKQAVFRFAPSPNGLLHLGHAFSALTNLRMARACGGRILLRIEDIDTARCTPELETAMLRDLEWIGFEWDEEPRRQSRHFDEYRMAVDRLFEAGLVYPSAMSRGQIRDAVARAEAGGAAWPRDPDGAPLYPGRERELAMRKRRGMLAGQGDFALRLDMARATAMAGGPLFFEEQGEGPSGETGRLEAWPEKWGDVILARKDAPASYHLCVVLDDALQGVSHVVRGRDLFHATCVHRLLQELLGLPAPVWFHHPLVLDGEGRKLSKSIASTAIRSLREQGLSAGDVCRLAGIG